MMQNYLDIAKTIAIQAGAILLEKYEKPLVHYTKSSSIDIVTEADRETEAYISAELLRCFPEHHLMGEEGGGQGVPANEAKYHWIVDPLDGTVNFANHIPHFCVSIALCTPKREPLVGVIYEPTRKDLYTAIKGEGAFLNGQKLQVTQTDNLLQSVVGSGFAYDKHSNPNNNTAQWTAFMMQVRDLRRMGSAALDLAYVAAGSFDGYWERNLKPWDVSAGVLLVQEAGGMVSDYRGGTSPQWGDDGQYVASNGKIHQAMLDVLKTSYGW
jgi:myo-inositol-1(or 4)-monophosphatase